MAILLDYLHKMREVRYLNGCELPAGYNYAGAEDYVLDRGQSYAAAALTAEELQIVQRAVACCSAAPFRRGECFYNAQLLALTATAGMIEYHEGYAFCDSIIPVLHGWCVIAGKVIDMTWRTTKRTPIYGEFPPTWEYYGIHFESSVLRDRILETGVASSLLDDFPARWPLFKQPRLRPVDRVRTFAQDVPET